MARVLVTGASGFLGGYLVRALERAGHEVVALVRDTSDLSGLSRCSLVRGSVTDREALRRAMRDAEAVFHLAGLMSLERSREREVGQVNVAGTWNVVEACLELGVQRLVHVSSVAAVGASASPLHLMNEESSNPLRPFRFPNYEAKAKAEEIVLEAARNRGLDAVVVNPSMIFGAGDAKKEARKGNLLAARGKVKLYPDGGLSVAHVEDVAAGIVAAWKRGRKGERYILGGENISVGQLLGLYAELAGKPAPRHRLPTWLLRLAASAADVFGLGRTRAYEGAVSATLFHWYDSSKAARELEYKPRPAREAIEQSVGWMRERGWIEQRPPTVS
ncbi:MAG TPA: NAD-dependent epimerase/dehydratase family protein [Bdellovibrionota bacterium]|nr:NAD-dependent epimerase/dehydratase family protein [Bdellovibrionota bacterium]